MTGTLSLKAAIERPVLYVLVAGALGSAGVLLAVMLRRGFPLSVVYGIWCNVGVALTFVCSAVLYSEPIRIASTFGLALIIAGVLLIEFGSRRSAGVAAPEVTR